MAEILVRADWRGWCPLELRLLYGVFKGPKDISFQESVLNFAVLKLRGKTVP